MAQPYLSIIIPAYNEAERLPLTLVDIDRYLRREKFSYEILVVNDGSTDKTAEIVKKMTPVIKNLKLIDNEVNRGKGAVVRQGMLLAGGKYRLFTDADNSTSVDQFNKMIPYFPAKGKSASGGEEGYDVIIGSRAIKGSLLAPPQPIYRQIPGRIGNLIIQLLLLPGIWDTQCGFKAFTAEAAEKIFSIMKITKWGFDIEALALAKHLGFRIKEIPVRWVNDPLSHVRASAYLQVLLETFKIRWWLWTGKYEIQSIKS
jgi:dolichyl-phosphate beta-glucosyltransferase